MNERFVIQVTDTATFVARYKRHNREWASAAVSEYAHGFRHLPRDPTDLDDYAEQLATWLRTDFPAGLTCRLVIPASWCFIHPVEFDAGRKPEQAAIFEFEQFLPLDLDETTCTACKPDCGPALVVGVVTEPIRSLLATLEQCDVFVESVQVDALFTDGVGETTQEAGAVGRLLIDESHATVAIFGSASAAPTVVRSVVTDSQDASAATRHVVDTLVTSPLPCNEWQVLSLHGDDGQSDVTTALLQSGFNAVELPSRESIQRTLDGAAMRDPAINLRRGELTYAGRWSSVQRRGVTCLAALALLLVAFGVKLRIENIRIAHGLDELRPKRSEIYAQVYPGETVPPEAALRLRSERIKLEGLTDDGRDTGIKSSDNGLALFSWLSGIVEQISADLKVNVTEILVDRRSVRLSGRTTSHGKAGELVQAINNVPPLAADPPQTKLRQDRTVDFRINAKPMGASSDG